jgi:hypothetical protein
MLVAPQISLPSHPSIFSEETTRMTESSTMASDIETVSPLHCNLIHAHVLPKTFDILLGGFEIRIRQLVKQYPRGRDDIYNRFKAFAKNLDQTVKQLFEYCTHNNDGGGDDPTQTVVLDAASPTFRTTIASNYDFPNALRSSGAINLVLYERTASEPTSAAGDRQWFVDNDSETLDHLVEFPENDFRDTPSMYHQTPFSGSETPSRSDMSAFPGDTSFDPAVLHQRVSDLGSPSRALRKQTSRGSCGTSGDFLADIRKSKKRVSNGEIEPRAKRCNRTAARNSSDAEVLQNLIRPDQITIPTHYSDFPTTQLISQSSYFPFQVGEVLDRFKNRLGQQERQNIPVLANLFFTIASPASFRQLFDAMKAMKAMKSLETLQVSGSRLSLVDLVGRLDELDSISAAHSLLRRFYLLQLFKQRASLIKDMQAERHTLRSGSRKGGEPGKISSLVLTKMTHQAYSSSAGSSRDGSGIFEANRRSLQNRLHAATNWNTLCEEHSVGIIALVPVGREFHIQNQRLVVQNMA